VVKLKLYRSDILNRLNQDHDNLGLWRSKCGDYSDLFKMMLINH
jgi:hypothetical protein